jgi:hypothetical protein
MQSKLALKKYNCKYWKKWYKANKNAYNKNKRTYYKQNKEDICFKAKIYRKNNPWAKKWATIDSRCNGNTGSESIKYYLEKGIKNLLTFNNLKYLWFRDKAYNMRKPSIHRKNRNKDYTMQNCEFKELSAHMSLHSQLAK